MEQTIAKLNDALIAITADQQGMTGDDLLTSLKAVKSVVRAIELVSKVSKVNEPTPPPPEKEPEPEETSEVETTEPETEETNEVETQEPEVVEAEVVEAKVEPEVMAFKPEVKKWFKDQSFIVRGDDWELSRKMDKLDKLEWRKLTDLEYERWETKLDGHELAIERRCCEWYAFIDGKEAFVNHSDFMWIVRRPNNWCQRDEYWNMGAMALAKVLGMHDYTDKEAEQLMFKDVEDKTRIVVPYCVNRQYYGEGRRTGVIKVEDMKKADWVPTAVGNQNGDMGLGAEFTLANGHKIELVVWHGGNGDRPFIEVKDNDKPIKGRIELRVAKHNGKTCLGIGTGSKCIEATSHFNWGYWCKQVESAALFEQVFVK